LRALAASRASRLRDYLRLVDERPHLFGGAQDGVRIVLDPEAIASIEETTGERYAARGQPAEWAAVGLRYEDPYLVVLVDAVTFPDGSVGVHHRTLPRSLASGVSGVAALPILEGRIVLIRHFRHPLRAWSWEIPRGAIEPGASAEETLRTELREEIEAEVTAIRPLGHMYGATGFMSQQVGLYLASLASVGRPALSEGVGAVRLVTTEEFESMARASTIVDSFTLGAFLQSRLQGFL
jgi:ADP-ribose pyrophosphatase